MPRFIPLCKPSLTESDIDAVGDVLRSGWITTGVKCAELEAQFQELLGCRHAVALTSATAGMHLALHALGIGPGDEVITPSLTWVSTVNLIVAAGAKPVFADVDRDTLMVTPSTVAPLLTERTRLVVPVHFAGAAAQAQPISALAARHDVQVIEDAAHALGTDCEGVPVGARGTAIFSLHPIKNVTTGEGGVLCTDDRALADRVRRLRFHGLGVDAFDRETQGRLPQAEVLEPGFKYNLPDMNAALGLGQLQRLEAINGRRAEIAGETLNRLREIEEIVPLAVSEQTTRHAWHLLVVRLKLESLPFDRDTFMARLKEKGIGTGLHFRAVHSQAFYRQAFPDTVGLQNTEWNAERIVSLPLYPDMTIEDVGRVVDAIKAVIADG